jgi:YD repeat-containing protein
MKKRFFFLSFCALRITMSWAQNTGAASSEELGSIATPSPTVAAMQQFTDIPVSYYNGTPQISIPIYEINTGKLKVPITLRYHGGGIRVGDYASNVGLGFSLAAEGCITQTVLGLQDNGTYPVNGLGFTNAALEKSIPAEYAILYNLSNNSYDGVPDLFLYNFGNYSGRFIIADQVRLLPEANLSVSSLMGADNQPYWKIITEDGTQYYFEEKTTTMNRMMQSVSRSYTWHLTRIVDADHLDSVLFVYEPTLEEVAIGYSYQKVKWPADNDFVTSSFEEDPGPGDMSAYITDVTGKQLKRILFNNGSVEYDLAWQDRLDAAGTHVPRLKNIFIKDREGNTIKTVHLEHDYFNTPGIHANDVLGNRLRLKGLSFMPQVEAINTPLEQKYSFTYNPVNLPDRDSRAQDHWGFYNGANSNPTLIPPIYLPNFTFDAGAANREPNPNYVKAGMLEKITYPTGGAAEFVWDIHRIPVTGPDSVIAYADSILEMERQCTGTESYGYFENSILVPSGDLFQEGIHAIFQVSMIAPGGQSMQEIVHAGAEGKLYECSDPNVMTGGVQKKSKTFGSGDYPGPYTYQSGITLYPGRRYRLWHHINSSGYTVKVKLIVKWPEKVPYTPADKLVGGCRIKEIRSYEQYNSNYISRSFIYQKAKLFYKPVYYKWLYAFDDPDNAPDNIPGAPSCDDILIRGLLIASNSMNSMGSGTHIGYNQVTEKVSGGGGMTQYNYENFNNGMAVGEVEPAWRKGLFQRKRIFDKDSVLKYETYQHNTYGGPITRFAGHTSYRMATHECAPLDVYDPLFPVMFDQKVYDFPSEWIIADTITETDYATNISSLRVNSYENPQHKQLTRAVTYTSDGTRMISKQTFPTDYVLTGSGYSGAVKAIKDLQNKHVHSQVIEQYSQKEKEGILQTVGAACNKFRTEMLGNRECTVADEFHILRISDGITSFQPMNISGNTQSIDSRYELKTKAVAYDTRANILTATRKGGSVSGALWGYSQSCPIARIQNAASDFIGFSSFETAEKGNWNYGDNGITTADHFTGRKAYNMSLSNSYPLFVIPGAPAPQPGYPHPNVAIPGKFVVSYWRKNGSITVGGTAPTTLGAISNGWQYCEHILTDPMSLLGLNGTGLIDELRFYPIQARVETYTYDPLLGMTSYDDPSGQVVFYEYDTMGRLSTEKDVHGNIIKKYAYQYQGQ